ncbi:MAG: hypothetical protein J5552_02560 [Prevotella sp.]|nr:hypothetical protein [Prevotella sp.]
MRAMRCAVLLLPLFLLSACNESDEPQTPPAPAEVTALDLTVTGTNVQAPYGNVYLFYTADTALDYATGIEADRTVMPDGTKAPLIDVSQAYSPTIGYEKNGQKVTLHPVSAYGTQQDGWLDNHSSVRYSQIHFDLTKLSAQYGRVGKDAVVLVVIVLCDEQSRTWVARPLQLRRNYLIHVALPDHKNPTFVPASELNVKWWQEEKR